MPASEPEGSSTAPPGLVQGNGLALQSDGKIIVVGASGLTGTTATMVVLRLDGAGALDPTFGCTDAPCSGFVNAITGSIGISATLQADSRIVVVGTKLGAHGENSDVVARFDNFIPANVPVTPPVPVAPRFTG
jgi:Domain of unknown function (DUF5122) beta-propeller